MEIEEIKFNEQEIDKIIQNMFELPKGNKKIDAVDCVGYDSYKYNLQEFYNLANSNYYSGNMVYIVEELSEMLKEYPDNDKLISLAKNLNYQSFKY